MKPIILDEKLQEDILKDMAERLKTSRNYRDFTYSYTPKHTYLAENEKIHVVFKPIAWIKMWALVENCTTECAWHGIITTNEERTTFFVEDILVYPQTITATNVDIDETKYETWHQKLPDEQYNNLRLQGHSHVRMGATPSSVDTTLYANMLETLQDDSFYLFMIVNKNYSSWWNIYDLKNNVIYESSDIKMTVAGLDPEIWSKAQLDIFCSKKTYTTPTYSPPAKTTPAITTYQSGEKNKHYLTETFRDTDDTGFAEEEYGAFYAHEGFFGHARGQEFDKQTGGRNSGNKNKGRKGAR